MYCSRCGNQIEVYQKKCPKCKSKISIPDYVLTNIDLPKPQKPKRKKILLVVGIALCAVFVVSLIVCFNCFNAEHTKQKQADLDFDFRNKTEIKEFMEIVCENADAEVAVVSRVETGGNAILLVKPHDMKRETINVRIGYSSYTEEISVSYNSRESENKLLCKDIIVKALEETLCGESKAKQYLDKLDSVGKELTIYDDPKVIKEYSLTDEAYVKIYCDGSFADDWSGEYCISKRYRR